MWAELGCLLPQQSAPSSHQCNDPSSRSTSAVHGWNKMGKTPQLFTSHGHKVWFYEWFYWAWVYFACHNPDGTVGLCVKRSPITKVTPVQFPVGAICELSCATVLCCATRVFQTIRLSSLRKKKRSWLCFVITMGWCGWLLNAPLHACFSNTLKPRPSQFSS